jgi:hypothetical protein
MSTEFNRDKPTDRFEADGGDAEQESEASSASARGGDRPAARHSETPYLPEQASGPANQRWQRIQAAFVDDPRKSVTEAHELVGELTQQIVDAFAQERDELERQWSKGADVSTEDLRVSLQRYRAFFSRLLPSMEQLSAQKKAHAAE